MLDPSRKISYLSGMPSSSAVVRFNGKPWTLNSERRMHYQARAILAREWRYAFMILAKANAVPKFDQVVLIIQPHHVSGPVQDVDACHPAAKAAIDGLVDAGVLKTDGPQHVAEIRYLKSLLDSVSGLSVIICEVTREESNAK